jgi:hypothetical protein
MRYASLLFLAAFLLAPVPAFADLRRTEPEMRKVSKDGLVARLYSDKMIWMQIDGDSRNLFLTPGGEALYFDAEGKQLDRASWDPEKGSIAAIGVINEEKMQAIRDVVLVLRDPTIPASSIAKKTSEAPAKPRPDAAIEFRDD